jgi:hypothetical protein
MLLFDAGEFLDFDDFVCDLLDLWQSLPIFAITFTVTMATIVNPKLNFKLLH